MSTKFNMSNPNPGIWFQFDEDNPESGEISLRPLNSAKREEIRKKTIKSREKFKHGQRFVIEDTNDELFSEMLWDYSIVDWSGRVDDDGKPIECTTENKLFLMRNHIGFSMFVSEKMVDLAEQYESRISLENENLSKGSSGSVTRANQAANNAKK